MIGLTLEHPPPPPRNKQQCLAHRRVLHDSSHGPQGCPTPHSSTLGNTRPSSSVRPPSPNPILVEDSVYLPGQDSHTATSTRPHSRIRLGLAVLIGYACSITARDPTAAFETAVGTTGDVKNSALYRGWCGNSPRLSLGQPLIAARASRCLGPGRPPRAPLQTRDIVTVPTFGLCWSCRDGFRGTSQDPAYHMLLTRP